VGDDGLAWHWRKVSSKVVTTRVGPLRSQTNQTAERTTDDAEIYRQQAPRLLKLATSLVGPSNSQDVVAAAVLRCMRSRSWPHVTNHQAYLYRAVVNEARALRRAENRRVRREHAQELKVATPLQVDPDILNAVLTLSTRQAAVVFLAYWEDLDSATIARVLGVSEGSVRRHLARARAHLRESLK
jgi:RNA polymerase sigma factor (sigma-70 family)